MDITIIVASEGKNLELANQLSQFVHDKGNTSTVLNLCQTDLPLYTPAQEKKEVPDQAHELNRELKESKAFIFLAPEYNGGIPPVMINAITWISRCGKDWREAFNNKHALIGTHSGGGGTHVISAMRMQLSFIGINVLGRSLITNYNKPLNEDSAHYCLDSLLKLI
ncbi:MAG: NAD(P)H-dependent oxidoreductase [Bdellovibrionales bacterium]|jgi:chromate reductase|nr:NAD(P)H-dependent oxidoreductase [Bdellovibrionales bacterium]